MKEGRVRLNRGIDSSSFKYEIHKDNKLHSSVDQTTTDFWLCKSKNEGGPIVRRLIRNETSPGVKDKERRPGKNCQLSQVVIVHLIRSTFMELVAFFHGHARGSLHS